MAKFCEGCPDRGNCMGVVEQVSLISSVTRGTISEDRRSATFVIEQGVAQGPTDTVVQYVDAKGGSSTPITIHGYSEADADNNIRGYVGQIDQCQGPTEIKKLFGLITRRECSASQ